MHKIQSLTLLLCLASSVCADSSLAQFSHPGITHSQQSIEYIKSKIKNGEQPWTTAWSVLKESRHASLEWQPHPFQYVERGPYNNPDVGSSEFSDDARAAYVHAVCWTLSGNEAHAKKAAEILDVWSSTLKSISNHDARLLVGMEGYEYCNAAELLRHTWDGWPQPEQARFEQMLRDIFYPTIQDFYPSANGNWDASMLQTMLAMGVFLEDQDMFDRGVDYFLNGKGNGALRNYFKPSGQCQESGRDQAHTQMGLNFLASTCEIAWNQGHDLYGAYENRLLKGFEYTAKYNLGMDVPYQPYRSFEGRYHYKSIADDSRGRFQSIYEKVLNHYENRKGIQAEFTRQVVMKLRESLEGRSAEDRQSEERQSQERQSQGGTSQRRQRDERRSRERRSRRSGSSALDTLMFCGQVAAGPASSSKVEQIDGKQDSQTRLPEFSWDHIPLYMHIRKDTSYTEEEIEFLAKFPLITFEKANGHKDHGTVEAGTLAAARAVKSINPNTTILYYRNVIVHYDGYAADEQLEQIPGALLQDHSGNTKLIRNRVGAYDLANANVRRWWAQACSRMTSDSAIDGIFLDGNIKALVPQYLSGQIGLAKKKQTMDGYHVLMKQTREAIGPSKLMLANILRARFENAGLEYLNYFDGSYLEGFFHNVGGVSYEDYVAKGIDAMQQAARQGKILAFTTGFAPAENPVGNTAENPVGNTAENNVEHISSLGIDEGHSNVQSDAQARAGLIYPLAIFLICAEKHSYFRIHEGYSANENDRWMRWFPEYDRPLGPPLGPATKDSFRYSRAFEHATRYWFACRIKTRRRRR